MTFKTVVKGSAGTEVHILQTALRMLQYVGKDNKPIVIDGVCGDNTVYAINQFQKRQEAYGYSCGNGDGSFGAKCWARLLGE